MEIIELLNFLWDIIVGLVFIYIMVNIGDAVIDDFIADRELKDAKASLIRKKAWLDRGKLDLIENITNNLPNLDINFNVNFNDNFDDALDDEYEE